MIAVAQKNRKRSKAFSLAELTVVIALFGLFSTTALSALNLTLKYWSRVSNQVEMNAMCRMVCSTIAKELRQAMPDQNTARAVYAQNSNGINTTQLSAVHVPRRVGQVTDYITFSEANPNTFDPSENNWDATGIDKYRIVTYKIESNQLVREMTTYDASSESHVVSAITAAADNVILRVTCKSAAVYELKVTCQRFIGSQTYEATLTTDIIVLGK
ncbi:type II secretion system protein [bacterium]|nr:type II secretion system protein [bacterium]